MRDERILLVDDEQGILTMLATLLRKEGYMHVAMARTGKEALLQLETSTFHLIVLDVMLPDTDGFQLCQDIRRLTNVPILFLTARSGDLDKLMGLGVGGDDYITKPFYPLEVVARIGAQLRRQSIYQSASEGERQRFQYGYLELNSSSGQLLVNGRDIPCTAKEFELLHFLCRHPNQVFTALQLYERVWGTVLTGDEKTVVIHISRLRKKVEIDPTKPRLIVNLRGIGYKFLPPDKG